MSRWITHAGLAAALCGCALVTSFIADARAADTKRRNIVFILVDDMRHDTMSCAGHQVVRTPHMDKLAADGVRFCNAFVTTSLCSPSRATLLTSTYTHIHGVINNQTQLDPALPTFPRELQKAGYETAFFGKWHMGHETDDPQPGFDHWASFKGQGSYTRNLFNINGQRKDVEGYVTDVLTDMAIDWLKQPRDRPFMLYLSHKAVHAMFVPAERHRELYGDARIVMPDSSLDTPENFYRRPNWVREQRDSWHGINDMYFKELSLFDFIRSYWRAQQAVDDSIGKLTAALKAQGLYDSTLIVFTSDNGFLFGEHGLIDKRCMYEESIRVPMIMTCPELFKGGQVRDQMVLNLDVAPTLVDAAGLKIPEGFQGASFLPLGADPDHEWRESFLYEYFWEPPYPETPTNLGVRTAKHKYIQYQGVWDTDELFDLEKDPRELHNRLSTSRRKVVTPDPEYRQVYQDLRKELRVLEERYGCRELPTWRR